MQHEQSSLVPVGSNRNIPAASTPLTQGYASNANAPIARKTASAQLREQRAQTWVMSGIGSDMLAK
jgi:hypothetical protein